MLCFGAEAGEYRIEAYPAYHADRPPMPDPLEWQWSDAPALLRGVRLAASPSTEDLEADDLLRLARRRSRPTAGGETLIFTGDRDMFQCASDAVTVLFPRTAATARRRSTPDGVRESYGIEPEQVPDFIALRGDPSDGLPGAKGIGAKTARRPAARARATSNT